MSLEGQLLEQKSLRAVTGKTADWNEIAKDCIAFANATGGRLLLGIEDGQDAPPFSQQIPVDLPDTRRRKLAERTVNVAVLPDVVTAANGGQYIELRIPRAMAVASTTDGRYFLRVADQSKPVTGDDMMRLASERSALPWETQTTLQIPRVETDATKRDKLLQALRASDRVRASVKEKTDCAVTHAIAFHNLAQNHGYRPSASQDSAPNARIRELIGCQESSFSPDHGVRLSQSIRSNTLSDNLHLISDSGVIAGGRYTGASPMNQSVLSTTDGAPWAIAAQPNLSHSRTHP